jgi:proteic killer suppression protein
MEIYFDNRKLQKLCNDPDKHLGSKQSKKLKQRLMELRAASCLAEISHLPPVRCHELQLNRKGQFSVDLEHPYRLIFICRNNPVPLLSSGGIDRMQITEIIVLGIVDTH